VSDTVYSSCPSHPTQGACRGCALEDADRLIRKRLEAFKTDDLATRVAADIFVRCVVANLRAQPGEPMPSSSVVRHLAGNALYFGRNFAEVVAETATQPQNAAEKDKP